MSNDDFDPRELIRDEDTVTFQQSPRIQQPTSLPLSPVEEVEIEEAVFEEVQDVEVEPAPIAPPVVEVEPTPTAAPEPFVFDTSEVLGETWGTEAKRVKEPYAKENLSYVTPIDNNGDVHIPPSDDVIDLTPADNTDDEIELEPEPKPVVEGAEEEYEPYEEAKSEFDMSHNGSDDFISETEAEAIAETLTPEKIYNAVIRREPFHELNENNVMYRSLKYAVGDELYPYQHVISNSNAEETLRNMANEIADLSQEGRVDEAEHLYGLMLAIKETSDDTGLMKAVSSNKGTTWEQGIVTTDGRTLRTRFHKETATKGNILKGDAALAKLTRRRGTGVPTYAMCAGSGIWLSITPPDRDELIMFFTQYSANKKEFGRKHQGITFGGYSAEIVDELTNFILRHVTYSNVSDVDVSDLVKYLDAEDIISLVCAIIAAMAPDGIPFKRYCDGDVIIEGVAEPCGNMWDALLDFNKTVFNDNDKLTREQIKHMHKMGRASVTRQDIINYRKQYDGNLKEDTFSYDEYTFKFKRPTLHESIEEGREWVNKVNLAYNEVLQTGIYTEKEKQHELNKQIQSSIMCNYVHYVESIAFDDGQIVNDRDTIKRMLIKLSPDNGLVEEFNEAVIKFRNANTITVAGVPEFDCPRCGKNHRLDTDNKADPNTPTLKHLIPLDIINMFFTILGIKYQSVISIPKKV